MAIPTPRSLPRGDETILVVEPEPETRKLAAFMLAKQGYCVLEARNSSEAVRVFDEHHGPVHLLLTAATMSRVNGLDLSLMLEVRSPGLRTLFLVDSEYERKSRRSATMRGASVVTRPFTMAILSTKVRQALDAPGKVLAAGLRA